MVGSTLATAAADGVVRLWSANLGSAKWQAGGGSYFTARSYCTIVPVYPCTLAASSSLAFQSFPFQLNCSTF